jgi:hypothetical protein
MAAGVAERFLAEGNAPAVISTGTIGEGTTFPAARAALAQVDDGRRYAHGTRLSVHRWQRQKHAF